MCAAYRVSLVVVALASFGAPLAAGCASGGGSGRDAGRRDTGTAMGFDTGPGFDAGVPVDAGMPIDAPRPDVGERPDTPPPPGTDSGPTIVRDTGVDAPTPPGTDAGPPPECVVAADCADGDSCNGIERCEFGMCTPGIAVTCDDGVACTMDSCALGACNYLPNDALCGSGMRCSATGCMSTSMCSETPCRLVTPQCGCTTGQSCYLVGAARMCAASGSAPEGASCTNANDCAAGNVCLNFAPTTPAVQMCIHHCAVDGDCAGGGLCIGQINDGTGAAIPGVRTCTRSCDPINQTGCAAGLECTLFREAAGSMRLFRDCTFSAGTGGLFTPCVDEDDCGPGYACQDVGFGPECTHWCNFGTGAGCTFGSCLNFAPPLIVGGVEYGVCG